jgi:uncharacterized membrane protein YGL010W
MRTVHTWLEEYGESHQNRINKRIHGVCVPVIMFSLLGLIRAVPIPAAFASVPFLNWSTLFVAAALAYYLLLSAPLAFGMLTVALGMLALLQGVERAGIPLVAFCAALFALAWIGQFVGHKIEGKKPSFFKDIQFLLIGPLWLLESLYRRWGIRY